MRNILRSRRLGISVACAIGFLGVCLACRRPADWLVGPTPTFDQLRTEYFDSLLVVIQFGLIGFLVGLALTAVQEALESLDRTEERQCREAERWASLSLCIERLAVTSRNGSIESASETEQDGTRGERVDLIRRATRDGDWLEAARLVELLNAEAPDDPEIDRLGREVESGRRESIESQLERIRVSQEVNDSERVLELFQEVAPILESSAKRSLEDDLARWFMALIQRRLRSGIIQAEIVTLSARVSEVFSGTVEGASLRAGLPTLRRTIGLCPRCGGPYTGVAEACPTCLGAAVTGDSRNSL